MQRSCASCDRPFEAKRSTAKYCGSGCRVRASRAGRRAAATPPQAAPPPPAATAAPTAAGQLETAARRELQTAGCLDTTLGWASIELARRVGSAAESGSSVASMVKVLRETMTEALKGTTAPDLLDELRDRRDAKRNAG